MANLITAQTFDGELVITERRATNEYIITDIHESITKRFVRVEVELGPFTNDTRPNGEAMVRGSSRRSFNVWTNESYDAVAETWDNAALLSAVTAILAAEATPVAPSA